MVLDSRCQIFLCGRFGQGSISFNNVSVLPRTQCDCLGVKTLLCLECRARPQRALITLVAANSHRNDLLSGRVKAHIKDVYLIKPWSA